VGEVGPDDDHRRDRGQRAERPFERIRRAEHDALPGPAMADQLGQVLAHGQPEQREQQCLGGIGAQDPDDVDLAEHVPEPADRGRHGGEHGAQISAARVVGEGDDLGRAHRERERLGGRIQAAEDHEPPAVGRKPLDEQAERQLGGRSPVAEPVGEVAVDRERQRGGGHGRQCGGAAVSRAATAAWRRTWTGASGRP
jgi:hypothetical protein